MNADPFVLAPSKAHDHEAVVSLPRPNSEARARFGRDRLYPVSLAAASIYDSALQRYLRWLDLTGETFDESRQPWVPVGHVGPLLVLGHCDPAQPAPLPQAWFQPVLLTADDYARQLKLCAPLIEATDPVDWSGDDWVAPRRFGLDPGTALVRPTSLRAALRFLMEYFPHRAADHSRLTRLIDDDAEPDERTLPAGYFGAAWVLMERGAVADPTVLHVAEATRRRLSAGVAARVRFVSEWERNLWLAVDRLPRPDLEDTVLNELGEGWGVTLLLMDPLRDMERAPSGPVGDLDGLGRKRVKIEDVRARSGKAEGEPGVIRLSTKEIRALEAYDSRRPDRDPLMVFLKELSAGIRHGATDLHVEVGLETYRVRARIDGYLEEWMEMPADFGRKVVGAAKEQFGMPPERWLPQDGACTVHHGSDIVNLRVAAYPIRNSGQKLAIRFLPRRGKVPRLHELMPVREAALMRRAVTRPYGLILLCGPTGSGKTTTTFAALSEINAPEVNITTMEDPVEFEMDGLNQAELDRERGVDWPQLLSGFLRQDPDVGVVGEIRDRETAETAIRLALTGHIVFATLHTMSCAHTVERLVDTGVNPHMFANAATLLVSQRLIRRLCPRCREAGARAATDAERAWFEQHRIAPPATVTDACVGGCPDCRNTGYKGQIGAFEMLPVTDEVSTLIAQRRSVREIEQWMDEHGFTRVYESALLLAARGETSLSEANQWQPVWADLPGSR